MYCFFWGEGDGGVVLRIGGCYVECRNFGVKVGGRFVLMVLVL